MTSVSLYRYCDTFSLLPDGDAAADGGLAGGLPGAGGSVHRGPELAALPLPRPPRAQRRLRVLQLAGPDMLVMFDNAIFPLTCSQIKKNMQPCLQGTIKPFVAN